MAKPVKKLAIKTTSTKKEEGNPIFQLWAWILLAWSLYRYFVKLPEWTDELIFKPLVFVGPVLWYIKKIEHRSLESIGITGKNFFRSLYIGIGFGFIFALEGVAANYFKYGTLTINPITAFKQYGFLLMILSLLTAVSEEILSRGFIFNRLYERTKSLPYASVISSVLFLCLHVPILVTSLKFQGMTLVLFLLTDVILGIANSVLMYYTGSLVAPILVHIFWNMTVALYL